MPQIIKPPPPGMSNPAVRAIHEEGDALAKRISAMALFQNTDAFKALDPLDAHLFTLQMEAMQTYLHILTIRLARTNDAANGRLGAAAPTLAKRPLQS